MGRCVYKTVLCFGTSPYYLNNINPVIFFPNVNNMSLISSFPTTMLQHIEVASSGKGCWRLMHLKWNSLDFPNENLRDQLSRRAEAQNVQRLKTMHSRTK